jgi:guanosine-3',5'-bis(diphosphate) 3'-pyrophosphohydrolase
MIINHTKEAFELQGKAREFAIKAHGGQLYGSKPYVHHLDMVSATLHSMRDSGWDIPEEAFVAVWLHDVLEDTDIGDHEVWKEFGEVIADAVIYLSKNYAPSRGAYLQAVKGNKISYTVKVADTLSNLQASVMSNDTTRVGRYTKQLAELMDK